MKYLLLNEAVTNHGTHCAHSVVYDYLGDAGDRVAPNETAVTIHEDGTGEPFGVAPHDLRLVGDEVTPLAPTGLRAPLPQLPGDTPEGGDDVGKAPTKAKRKKEA